MTPEEEITYLADLLMQAALWRVQPDEGRTPLELEVNDRLERLKAYSASKLLDKSDYQALEAAKLNYHLEHVKVKVDGKWRTVKKSDCIQVPFKCSRTGYKWVLKEEANVETGAGQAAEQDSVDVRGDEEHSGRAGQGAPLDVRGSIPLVSRGFGGDVREVGRIRLPGSGNPALGGDNGPLPPPQGLQPEGGDIV